MARTYTQTNNLFDYGTAVGVGIIANQSRVTALGHNPNIPLAQAAADVWEGGGDYPFLTTASQLEVLSSSANDTAAGTGARTVLISGLSSTYAIISEVITLNGVTPVTTVNSYLRVNIFTTTSSGSGKVNAGDLTLRVISGGSTQSIARAGFGFGRNAIYTVPAGNTLFVQSIVFTISASDPKTTTGCEFAIKQISSTGNARIPLTFQILSTTPYRHEAKFGIVLTEKTDFIIRVTTTGQINSNVTAAMEGVLINNNLLT
jgi:hypothetical protein